VKNVPTEGELSAGERAVKTLARG